MRPSFLLIAHGLPFHFQVETWTDWLWPPPQTITVDEFGGQFKMPKDHKLKVYFDPDCAMEESNPTNIMQVL